MSERVDIYRGQWLFTSVKYHKCGVISSEQFVCHQCVLADQKIADKDKIEV